MISDETQRLLNELKTSGELFANLIKVLANHIIGQGRTGEINDLNIPAEMLNANSSRALTIKYNEATAMYNIELGPKND